MEKYNEMFVLTDKRVEVMGADAAVAVVKKEYEAALCATVYPAGLYDTLSEMTLEEQLDCISFVDSFTSGIMGTLSLEKDCPIMDSETVKEAYGRASKIRGIIDQVLITELGTLLGVYAYGKVLYLGGEIAYTTELNSGEEYNGAGYKSGITYMGTKYLALVYLPSLLFCDTVYQTEANKALVEFAPDEGVRRIASGAFLDCDRLERVFLPEGIEEIGYRAFAGCKSLEKITIPASVTEIDASAFKSCEGLREVIILGSSKIGSSAFAGCKSLERVILMGEDDYALDAFAFHGCESLAEIVGAEKIVSVGEYAFSGCASLKAIKLSDRVTSIKSGTFGDCKSLTVLDLPKMTGSIGQYIISGCDSLVELHLPSQLWYLATDALALCTSLRKVHVAHDMLDEVKQSIDEDVVGLVEFITFIN